MDTKKKVTYAAIAIVMAIVAWMAKDMFGGGSDGAVAESVQVVKPNPDIPIPSSLSALKANQQQGVTAQAGMSEREMQLMKLQQETQVKYLEAINQLQMLKVEKDIAETNKDIAKAKLDSVTAQKGIVDLLTPQKPIIQADSYIQKLDQTASNNASMGATTPAQSVQNTEDTTTSNYTVVSVSRLRGQWAAVIGSQGRLYNVKVGDVLVADGSVVLSITRDGVILDKNGKQRRLSMIPII